MDILPGIDPDIDCSEVEPISQKRSLAFINHYILRTVTFLNTFSRSCEARFMDFEHKLQKIEASICILESKLSSIPDLNVKGETSTSEKPQIEEAMPVDSLKSETNEETISNLPTILVNSQSQDITVNEIVTKDGIPIKNDPRYAKYFKMLHFGVPEEAIKLKMQSDGVEPSILNEPNKIVEKFVEETNETSDNSDDSSD